MIPCLFRLVPTATLRRSHFCSQRAQAWKSALEGEPYLNAICTANSKCCSKLCKILWICFAVPSQNCDAASTVVYDTQSKSFAQGGYLRLCFREQVDTLPSNPQHNHGSVTHLTIGSCASLLFQLWVLRMISLWQSFPESPLSNYLNDNRLQIKVDVCLVCLQRSDKVWCMQWTLAMLSCDGVETGWRAISTESGCPLPGKTSLPDTASPTSIRWRDRLGLWLLICHTLEN